jgi:hypothetical protein
MAKYIKIYIQIKSRVCFILFYFGNILTVHRPLNNQIISLFFPINRLISHSGFCITFKCERRNSANSPEFHIQWNNRLDVAPREPLHDYVTDRSIVLFFFCYLNMIFGWDGILLSLIFVLVTDDSHHLPKDSQYRKQWKALKSLFSIGPKKQK